MKTMLLRAAAAITLCALPNVAQAAVTFDINENGGDVLMTAGGTFDTTASSVYGEPREVTKGILGSIGYLAIGGTALGNSYVATPVTLMAVSAVGGQTFGSGTTIGFTTDFKTFFLDKDYINNAAITSTGIFKNATLSSLGLVKGDYEFAVGGNLVTLKVGHSAAVPEPATWALMLAGFAMAGVALRRRRGGAAVGTIAA